MKRVGELLKHARQEKGISLEEVVKATKIKRDFLEALEKNDFQKISSSVVATGFIKNYADFLGLSPRRVLAVFRRDTKRGERKEVIPQGIKEGLEQSEFNWNPKATFILIIVTVFLFLAIYLGYQYFSLTAVPDLELFQPQEGQRVEEEQLTVFGRTSRDAAVEINGRLVPLSSEGEFRYQIDLLPGENRIVVEAANKGGKKRRIEREILRVIDEGK